MCGSVDALDDGLDVLDSLLRESAAFGELQVDAKLVGVEDLDLVI
jgi:hypothetical protein